MIERTQAFKTSDDKTFESLAKAQEHELGIFILAAVPGEAGSPLVGEICAHIVAGSDRVVDILTTKESSRTKARKVNGGTKKRAPKTETPASLTLK